MKWNIIRTTQTRGRSFQDLKEIRNLNQNSMFTTELRSRLSTDVEVHGLLNLLARRKLSRGSFLSFFLYLFVNVYMSLKILFETFNQSV